MLEPSPPRACALSRQPRAGAASAQRATAPRRAARALRAAELCAALVRARNVRAVLEKLLPVISPLLSMGPQIHAILGAALSFIMVFRTNTAYSRWWEARLLWGVVNNTTRSVVARAPSILKNEAVFTQMTTEFMAFAITLKNRARTGAPAAVTAPPPVPVPVPVPVSSPTPGRPPMMRRPSAAARAARSAGGSPST